MEMRSCLHDFLCRVKGMVIRMKKVRSGFHDKKWCVIAGICMMTAALCGCGGKYPELTDEDEQAILRYAATLLYENDQNRDSRLMTEDEMILAMQRRAAHAYMPEPEPTKAPEQDADGEHADGRPEDDLIGGEVVETRTLAEFFGLPGIDISYQGYFFTKSYPEDSEDDFYFAMDALYGNELLILQYTITNQNAQAAQVNILDLKPRFRAFINDGSQINALTTLLLDDMKTTNCTLEPGESRAVVVVFEVTEAEAASMQQLRLTVKTEEDSWTVELLEPGEPVSDNGEEDYQTAENSEQGMPVLYYELPEEFIEQADGMYLAPNYPDDPANIVVIASDYDPETFQYTKESYCEELTYLYGQLYGDGVKVDCTEFTESEMNGCRTRLIRISCAMLDMEQVQFAVETGENKTMVITYSQVVGGSWTDAFNASLDSIRIEAR